MRKAQGLVRAWALAGFNRQNYICGKFPSIRDRPARRLPFSGIGPIRREHAISRATWCGRRCWLWRCTRRVVLRRHGHSSKGGIDCLWKLHSSTINWRHGRQFPPMTTFVSDQELSSLRCLFESTPGKACQIAKELLPCRNVHNRQKPMTSNITVQVFVDGDESGFLHTIIEKWQERWASNYFNLGILAFAEPVNVKALAGLGQLPIKTQKAFLIRNPDIFFVATVNGREIVLGGVEITVHSPDGSNVEKRYPFIWSGRQFGFSAFIVSPFMKERPNGQVNRLPNRHSCRNLELIAEWKQRGVTGGPVQQILPIQELQENHPAVRKSLGLDLFTWQDLSAYFCDLLAFNLGAAQAGPKLSQFVANMETLALACKAVTRFTQPSSFIEIGNRWIQIYNTRPDSGHWERGEGQFDSIDGRLMFTLDKACLNKSAHKLEFWMPQLSKKHPWVVEQIERDHGSKRLRNIVKILSKNMDVKFVDDLTVGDISILQANPRLTLERLDWKSDLYSLTDLLGAANASEVAKAGLKSPSIPVTNAISDLLSDKSIYLSTHRIYEKNWQSILQGELNKLPANSTVLVPRIPRTQFINSANFGYINVIFAEECTKTQLMAIRQLHRHCFD